MKKHLRWAALGIAASALAMWAGEARAAVRLPKIFGDGMVVQQKAPVPVWGWANAGEKVTVSFAGRSESATADADGKWMVKLPEMPADKQGREMTVAGENTVAFKDVLVGEVWICGGQSNMEMVVNGCRNAAEEKAAATNPLIRHIKVTRVSSAESLADITGQWTACSPETVGNFTAVGYFFARELAKELDVPVGLIGSNWGGTRIEPWTPPAAFRAVPELKALADQVEGWSVQTEAGRAKYAQYIAALKTWIPMAEAAVAAKQQPPPAPESPLPRPSSTQPTHLYNSMIHPLVPYAIRGAIWYQGEANGNEGVTYIHKTGALVAGWRQVWGSEFPFYWVQLANYRTSDRNNPSGGDGYARTREAQMQAMSIANTGMACIIDIGEEKDIHPKNKQDVGKRLALWALAKTYGREGLVFSGPLYKGSAVEGGKIRIAFDHAAGLFIGLKDGLEPPRPSNEKLRWVAIAGEDKVWQWADAVVDGETLVVSCDKVEKPVAVRYGFTANPDGPNLYNAAGLPASPFRTDEW